MKLGGIISFVRQEGDLKLEVIIKKLGIRANDVW